jgi:uncharacterized phage protein (TIGR02220 family)
MKRKIGIYGIIPVKLLADKKIKPNDIRVYISLSSFQGTKDNCWPSLKEIGERADLKVQTVSMSIQNLRHTNWIGYKRRGLQKTNIYVVLHDIDNVFLDYQKTLKSGKSRNQENLEDGLPENPEIKTSGKPVNPIIKEKNKRKEQEKRTIYIVEIIEFLNSQAGTKFKPTISETIKHISARLKDGYSIDDFKIVISKKCKEWIGTEMERYIRPKTLFTPSNFESYLNQKIINTKEEEKLQKMKEGGWQKYGGWTAEKVKKNEIWTLKDMFANRGKYKFEDLSEKQIREKWEIWKKEWKEKRHARHGVDW